jgi:glycosyltransferase involved in cell wall biosynthesis
LTHAEKKINVAHVIGKEPAGGVATFLKNLQFSSEMSNFNFFYIFGAKKHKVGFIEFLEKNSIKYLKFDQLRLNRYFTYVSGIRNFLIENDISILHIHSPNMLLVMKFVCLGLNLKFIVHAHSTKLSDSYIKTIRNYLIFNLAKFSNFQKVACSKDAGFYLFKNKPFKIIKNAIPIKKFFYSSVSRDKIREKYKIDQDALVLINVANFFPVKNHEFSLKILSRILSRKDNAKLILVGSGPEEYKIKNLTNKLNIESSLIVINDADNISELLSASDIFILPSIFEGIPLSLIEAQANGLVCLVSEHVSKDVRLIESMRFLPIDEGVDIWVEEIISSSLKPQPRLGNNNSLLSSEYNLECVAKEIASMYKNND